MTKLITMTNTRFALIYGNKLVELKITDRIKAGWLLCELLKATGKRGSKDLEKQLGAIMDNHFDEGGEI